MSTLPQFATPHPHSCHPTLHIELLEAGEYVFDGNRVTARQSRNRKRQVVWWLDTLDPNISLFISRDLRVRVYKQVNGHARLDLLHEFETVFDALKPLEEALQICSQYGHAWRRQTALSNEDHSEVVKWCVICGTEQGWFSDTAEWLTWPEAAEAISERKGTFPTLHGDVLGSVL